jgi:hypothetical protein
MLPLDKNKIYNEYVLNRYKFENVKLDKMIDKMISSFIGYYKKKYDDINEYLKKHIKDVLYYFYFPDKIDKEFVKDEIIRSRNIKNVINFIFINEHSKQNMKAYISDTMLSNDEKRYQEDLEYIYTLWMDFLFETEQSDLFFNYVYNLFNDKNLNENNIKDQEDYKQSTKKDNLWERTKDIENNNNNSYKYKILNNSTLDEYFLNSYNEIRDFCKNMNISNYRKFIKTKDTNKTYNNEWLIFTQ